MTAGGPPTASESRQGDPHQGLLQFARWPELTNELRLFFLGIQGGESDDAIDFYELFYYWFSVPGQVCRLLRSFYGTATASHWQEEKAGAELSAAYWQARGDQDLCRALTRRLDEACFRMKDPFPTGQDRSAVFDASYDELLAEPEVLAEPKVYCYTQYSLALRALGRPMDLVEALRTLVTVAAREPEALAAPRRLDVDGDLPFLIVDEMRERLPAYGVEVPPMRVLSAFTPALELVAWEEG